MSTRPRDTCVCHVWDELEMDAEVALGTASFSGHRLKCRKDIVGSCGFVRNVVVKIFASTRCEVTLRSRSARVAGRPTAAASGRDADT